MRTLIILFISFFLASVGCARVQVEAPKDPIKVDISMRLDVYQHVQEDIDEIESIVSGAPEEPQSKMDSFFVFPLIKEAYAAEELSEEVEQAALRRRDRKAQLIALQKKGIVGEDSEGLVEIRNLDAADDSVKAVVGTENVDRMVIYMQLAEKNGTSVEEIQKVYAERLQADAEAGTPIEVPKGSGYKWVIKK